MPHLLEYLLQVNGALLLFVAVYYALLRRLTFHTLNRWYLLGAVAFSVLYPLIDMAALWPRPAVLATELTVWMPVWPGAPAAAPAPAPVDYYSWVLGLYWVGVAVLAGRLLMQGVSLGRLHQLARPVAQGVLFREVPEAVTPFSFWQTIYLNPTQHQPTELAAILLHEQVHIRQWHTLDVLLGQVLRVFCWPNPAAWLLLRAVQENLEFIADHAVLTESALGKQDYQYSLVRLSTLAQGPPLVLPFSFVTLKSRITMMNSRPSSARQLLRYAAGLSLLTVAAVGCATPKASETPQPRALAQNSSQGLDKMTYFLNGQEATKEQTFAAFRDGSMYVFKGAQPNQKADLAAMRRDFGTKLDDGIMLLVSKGNNDLPAVQEFAAKYKIDLHNTEQPISAVESRNLYGKLVAGEAITDAEIGDRLILLNKQEITPAQLRALPANTVSGVSVTNSALPKYGERGSKGMIFVLTKQEQTLSDAPTAVAEQLYFLDGKPISKAEIDKLDPKTVSHMMVLKKEEALRSFGPGATAGAVLIVTKGKENSEEVLAFMREHNMTLTPASPEVNKINSAVVDGKGLSEEDLGGRLLIVNGQEAPVAASKIAAGRLQTVGVLDAKKATAKYGAKGKNGAVVITTN